MAINNVTGEATFSFDGKTYAVRPELGLAAAVEGSKIIPWRDSGTPIPALLKMFAEQEPSTVAMGRLVFVILQYTGDNTQEQIILEKVFTMQSDRNAWFELYADLYAIVISLARGGIQLTSKEIEEAGEAEETEGKK